MLVADAVMTTPPPASPDAGPTGSLTSNLPVAGRRQLVVGMALVIPATAVLLVGVIVLINRPLWWRGWIAATVVGVIAAGVSLLPLLWGMRRGPGKAVMGFFVAGGLRAAVALGGGMLAVHVGGYPLRPTLLLVVGYYFAALAVEAVVLGRSLWTMKL